MIVADRYTDLAMCYARRMWPRAVACGIVALAACGDDSGAPDARVVDGAAVDAAVADASPDGTLNGCTALAAQDATAGGAAIAFTGVTYTPKCVRIRAGQTAAFTGSFTQHPLRAGTITSTTVIPDPTSPILATSAGTSATFTFPSAGSFPYYCEFHYGGGMTGVVYVDP